MKRQVMSVLLGVAALAAVMVAPVGASAATHSVGVDESNTSSPTFDPNQVNADVGDTVRWVWTGITLTHNLQVLQGGPSGTLVYGDPGYFPTPPNPSPEFDDYAITEPGEYYYFCSLHGATMNGTINVAGEPTFTISGAPKNKTVKVGKQATYTATVKNTGSGEGTAVKVSISGPANKVSFVGAKSKTYPTFAAAATQKPAFKVKPKASAKNKNVTLTLTVDSAETDPVKTTVKIKGK